MKAELLFVVSLLAVSCARVSEKDLLQFPVKVETVASPSVAISPEKVFPDPLCLVGFGTSGDKMILTANLTNDHCLDVIDLATGETLQQLCRRGRGPGEFLSISPCFSFGDGSVVVYDTGAAIFSEVSIDGGLNGNVTHQMKLKVKPGRANPIIISSYKVSEHEMLAYNSIQGSMEYVSIENPYYALFDWNSGDELRGYNLFDASKIQRYSEGVKVGAFALEDCLNAQKSTLCFAMNSMPVFGFLDISSGKVKGIRLKGEPAYSVKEPRICFSGICAQGEYIYALYSGELQSTYSPDTSKTSLYVLDWQGRILKKYELDGLYQYCCANPDKLYLSRIESDLQMYLYQLDIKEL